VQTVSALMGDVGGQLPVGEIAEMLLLRSKSERGSDDADCGGNPSVGDHMRGI
jgi:hypothetical protein